MDRTSDWQQGHFLRRVSFYLSSLQKVRCGGENVESILGFPQSFRGSNLLLLKLVTLPSSSLQTCQNPDLLPPFFLAPRFPSFEPYKCEAKNA